MNKTQYKYTNEVFLGCKFQVTSYLIDDKKFIELKKFTIGSTRITEKFEDKVLKYIRADEMGHNFNTLIHSIKNPTMKERLGFIKKYVNQ